MPLDRLEDLQFNAFTESLRWGGRLMLDSLGWKPLSSEFDYDDIRRRVREEVFAEDYLRARYPVPE